MLCSYAHEAVMYHSGEQNKASGGATIDTAAAAALGVIMDPEVGAARYEVLAKYGSPCALATSSNDPAIGSSET